MAFPVNKKPGFRTAFSLSATASPRSSVHRGLEFSSARDLVTRDQTQASTPFLMRANDVYCATTMWPRPSLGLPCPVPIPEALSTVLAWCTRRPSKVRTLVIHIVEFLLYTIAFSLALQSTRVSSSWLRGDLVLTPPSDDTPPFIRVNASINRHKPRNSNPFTTEARTPLSC